MIRKEYIEEIRKYVLSAKLEQVYNADLKVKDKDANSLMFPSFDQVYEYINKADSIDKFFERIFTTLKNYKEHINSEKNEKYNVECEPLKKRVQLSENTINKLLSTFNQKVCFEPFGEYKINKCVSLIFDDSHSDSLNFLYELLEKLAIKIKKYIITNSIYSTAYKVEFKYKIKDLDKENPNIILSKCNESVKKIIDKVYIPDFLSDGSDDLKEMMKFFWNGLLNLLHFSKSVENIVYEINNEHDIKNAKEWLKKEINKHFSIVENALEENVFDCFSDVQIRDIYEKIIRIKVPKEINPRSEKDMPSNKCKAEKKLEELIGLDSVKVMIEKIKAYATASMDSSDLNLHMAFYGNPGTGKTEVARLMGEILYEYGVLPKKKYVEATRSKLVGAYIGHTALKTQAIVEEAMGGVLFIDEAYSLAIEGDSIDFGHEAVAELIQAMETYKGKFCVILAGYKNPLKKMLSTNPGFDSRIQFHIDFPNYSRDEISEILQLLIDKDGYLVNEDALNKMLDVIDSMRINPDFANARVARNVVQQCIMCLNLRTGDSNDKTITIEDVNKYIKDANLGAVSSTSSGDKVLSGEELLSQLIGLNNVKLSIKKIRAYAKKNKGSNNLNLHMAFAGNPGTGKTEVANIISRILYETGVLDEAKVIVANRESLIGQFVGHTAKKTKEIVDKAMGGVLFIDEAYSLFSGTSTDFGSEAIATLIDEMEKNKGKFCVVVAGYNGPLKEMIDSNPGFGSRIQFWINFQDYSRDELKQIALLFLNKESVKYSIKDDALELLLDITDLYRHNADFANARTVRNILQDVILNQNLRVEEELDNNEITIDDVYQYIDENNLQIEKKKSKERKVSLDIINSLYEFTNTNLTVLSQSLFEDTVVSLSGLGSQGTGFIVSPDGLCLTCAHCINEDVEQKARIVLELVGGHKINHYVNFEILYKDTTNDFALIKLQSLGLNYKFLPLAKETATMESLQKFIMAGFPFGGELFTNISITSGSIASVNNYNGRKVVFADMFGKPGNSGSPVIDERTKKVIGIFWGGIKGNSTMEVINSFTPIDVIWESLKEK